MSHLRLVIIIATWLPVGYLASRLWIAIGLRSPNAGVTFDWRRRFKTGSEPAYFALGCISGWATAGLGIYIGVILGIAIFICGPVANGLRHLGLRLMPHA